MAQKQKSLHEWAQNHPLKFTATLVVATGTLVAGVMGAFWHAHVETLTERHATEVAGLHNQLASINRKLAGGDFLNVAKFLVPASERSRIAPSDKFFSSDLFYAAMPPGWSYEEMKDTALWNSIYGTEGDKPDNVLTGISPIHVWRRGSLVHLEGNGVINHIAPMITVQRFANKEILTHFGIDSPTPMSGDETVETKKLLDELRRPTIFQGDIVGAVLAQNFSIVFDQLRFVKGVSVELVNINKVANVLYCQVLITLSDGSIDGKKFDQYYLICENTVISSRDYLYVISDVVPSEDPSPRSPAAAEVTQWLNEFAIISQ
jgi:hypothetical protein